MTDLVYNLRVGNNLLYDDRIITVTAEAIIWFQNHYQPEFYKLIPITEEILLNIGFYAITKPWFLFYYKLRHHEYTGYLMSIYIKFESDNLNGVWECYMGTERVHTFNVKYLHELQNIILDFTGDPSLCQLKS